MKKIFCSLFGLFVFLTAVPAFAAFSCGAGYVLASHSKIDGVNAKECVKLWCRDLEANKVMGSGDRAASGYRETSAPVELSVGGDTIACFGDRRWCAGETVGVWAPEYGMYVRGDDDGTTYKSYQKGSCFAWRLEKPDCPNAVLVNGEWVCVTASGGDISNIQKSSVRRTGTMRRVMR